ncbi:MAG: hypothetical protein JXJ04_09060 [Spirochaetales bacterium]|nr:hypothetical protein [Spirochaetales bacterium]
MRYVRDKIETQDDIYTNWYVLNVTTGKEFFIKTFIEKYTNPSIKMTIFQREILHKRRGKKVKVIGALFSGYIFIHEKINTALSITKKYLHAERIFPVSVDKKPCKVNEDEMKVLLRNSGQDGIFRLSKGKKIKDTVHITDGALKDIRGNIIWIDEKRNKAKVEINLFNRKIKVSLGLDIVEHTPRDNIDNNYENQEG